MITLKCGCSVSDKGKFIVADNCKCCKECNLIADLHPFGEGRLE